MVLANCSRLNEQFLVSLEKPIVSDFYLVHCLVLLKHSTWDRLNLLYTWEKSSKAECTCGWLKKRSQNYLTDLKVAPDCCSEFAFCGVCNFSYSAEKCLCL